MYKTECPTFGAFLFLRLRWDFRRCSFSLHFVVSEINRRPVQRAERISIGIRTRNGIPPTNQPHPENLKNSSWNPVSLPLPKVKKANQRLWMARHEPPKRQHSNRANKR